MTRERGQSESLGVTVTDGGRGVRLDGNRWVWVPYEYAVTDDTLIEFEYRSSKANRG